MCARYTMQSPVETMMVGNAKLALLFVSVAAFGCLRPVDSYTGGAPTEVCEDMLPQHGAPAQTKDSPYTLTPNRKSVKAGESITLTLAAKDLSKFKGFMVQARDNAENPIGTFAPLPASKNNNEFKGKWKLISCPKGPNNVSANYSVSCILLYTHVQGAARRGFARLARSITLIKISGSH